MDLGGGKTHDCFLCTFISPYEFQFLFVFEFFCSRSIFFESFRCNIIHKKFVDFPFKTFKFKKTSTTLNISFHINLGRFIGD